jgi:carboxylesterase
MIMDPEKLKHGYAFPGNNGYLVICIHGFGGTPAEHYLTACALNQAGYSVSVPLLKGHGTTMEEWDHSHWKDWTGTIEEEYAKQKGAYKGVYFCGLSMGGLLTLYMAEHHPEIKAISLMAPALIYKNKSAYFAPLALPFKRHLPYGDNFPGLKDEFRPLLQQGYGMSSVPAAVEMTKLQSNVKRNLRRIKQPLIIYQSDADTLVDPKTENYVLNHVSSEEKTGVRFAKSSHVMSLDSDRESIFWSTIAFFRKHQ